MLPPIPKRVTIAGTLNGDPSFVPYDSIIPPMKSTNPSRTINTGTAPNAYPFDSFAQVASTSPFISSAQYDSALQFSKPERALRGDEVLSAEKRRLHETSLQHALSWSDTILGQRKKRLAAMELKKQAVEDERVRNDQLWAKMQEEERANILNRARTMQFNNSNSVRNLHSQMLNQNVMIERELQQKWKDVRKRNEKRVESYYQLQANKQLKKAEEDEMAKIAREKAARLEIAQGQLSQLQTKQDEMEQLKQERSLEEKAQSDKAKQDALDLKRAKRERDSRQHLAEKSNLMTSLANKKLYDGKERAIDDRTHIQNQRFIEMKMFNLKKKEEREQDQKREHDEISEKVSEITVSMNREQKKIIDEYIVKIADAHAGDDEIRQLHEREARERRNKDIETYRVAKMAELAVRREIELQEKRDEGFNVKKGAQEEAKEKRHAQEKRAMIEAQLQQANVQLADEARRRKSMAQAKEHQMFEEQQAMNNDEKDHFFEYAGQLLLESKEAGKDVSPILRVMNEHQRQLNQIFSYKGEGPKFVDTFSRLGFI